MSGEMKDFTLVIEDAAQRLCPGLFLVGGRKFVDIVILLQQQLNNKIITSFLKDLGVESGSVYSCCALSLLCVCYSAPV